MAATAAAAAAAAASMTPQPHTTQMRRRDKLGSSTEGGRGFVFYGTCLGLNSFLVSLASGGSGVSKREDGKVKLILRFSFIGVTNEQKVKDFTSNFDLKPSG